jgi:hypothetical protein
LSIPLEAILDYARKQNDFVSEGNLSIPLEAILDYARKQNDFVSARKIQSSIRLFRDTPAPEIRQYFQWLADKGYGIVRGSDDALEFSAS